MWSETTKKENTVKISLLAIQFFFITFVIGPWLLIGDDACEPFCVEPADDIRGLNAAIDWDTPSANINCSRNSMLVRPLANVCLFFFFVYLFLFLYILDKTIFVYV